MVVAAQIAKEMSQMIHAIQMRLENKIILTISFIMANAYTAPGGVDDECYCQEYRVSMLLKKK